MSGFATLFLAAAAGVRTESTWALLIQVGIAPVAVAAASYISAAAARVNAAAAKDAADKSRENGEKLDHIGRQTDGRISDVLEANRLLRDEMVALKQAVATLQGREQGRRDQRAVAPGGGE